MGCKAWCRELDDNDDDDDDDDDGDDDEEDEEDEEEHVDDDDEEHDDDDEVPVVPLTISVPLSSIKSLPTLAISQTDSPIGFGLIIVVV